jgi:hypothetical protein
MYITKPYHSESRTIWYVRDAEDCVATLELGQEYRSGDGAVYKLVDVTWHTGYVQVERNGDRYLWRVESLINQHMKRVN